MEEKNKEPKSVNYKGFTIIYFNDIDLEKRKNLVDAKIALKTI